MQGLTFVSVRESQISLKLLHLLHNSWEKYSHIWMIQESLRESILSRQKVLEKWKGVYMQLESHLVQNKLLYDYQSGFRQSFSTDSCLIHLLDFIKCQSSRGLYTGMVMLDLQKAFDTVNHSILLKKIKAMGLESVEWFQQGSRKCGSTGAALLGNGRPNWGNDANWEKGKNKKRKVRKKRDKWEMRKKTKEKVEEERKEKDNEDKITIEYKDRKYEIRNRKLKYIVRKM